MRRRFVAMAWLTGALAALGIGARAAGQSVASLEALDDGAALPRDPRLVERELDNGLRVLALRHDSPPGRVVVWVRVDVGSLDERDEELGFARLAQEASVFGARAGGWQKALDQLTRLGLDPEEAFGGRTRPEQTVFWLALPDGGDDALDAGMSLLSGVVFGVTLGADEVEGGRRVALERLRAGQDPRRRAREQWLGELLEGSLIARRPAEGDEASLIGAPANEVLAFRRRWYTPSNTTVMLVGDVEPERAVGVVSRWLGSVGDRAPPPRQDRGAPQRRERTVAVGSDEELVGSTVALLHLGAPGGRVRTVGALRRFLLEQACVRAFEARLREAMSAGRLSAYEARVSSMDVYRAASATQVVVTGGDDWRALLRELCVEVARLRAHGFTRGELEEGVARVLTRLEELGDVEASVASSEVISWLSYNDAAGHTWMAIQDELALARRALLEIDEADLNETLEAILPRGSDAIVVSAVGVRGRADEALEIAGGALDSATEALAAPAAAPALVEAKIAPGRIVELGADPITGVSSAWLANGARLHHRRTEFAPGRVLIRATLGGGGVPSARDRELADAAAYAWDEGGVVGIGSAAMRRLLAGLRVEADAWHEDGTLTLEIETSPRDVVIAMELLHRKLSDPLIEPAALERWRGERLIEIGRGELDADRRAGDLLEAQLTGSRAGDEAGVLGVTLGEAQAWLDRVVRDGTLEVAIVGDLSRAEAFELGERYVGSLGARGRVSPAEGARGVAPGEPVVIETIEARAPVAAVRVAMGACDSSDVRDVHLLSIAGRVLAARLNRELRDRAGLVSGVECDLRAGEPARCGALVIRTTCAPSQAGRVAGAVREAIGRMGADGPTVAEMAAATSQIESEVLDAWETPAFWAQKLGDLDRSGRSLRDIASVLERQETFTPMDVRAAVARQLGAGDVRTVIVRSGVGG